MSDHARLPVVLLVNVSVEHRRARTCRKYFDRLRSIWRGPVPLRHQIEQRPMSEDHERRVHRKLGEVFLEPIELSVAQVRLRIGDVVERDEVHALVVERIVRGSKVLLKRFAVIDRSVVLAREEVHVLDVQLGNDALELGHARAPQLGVVGRVRQIAGEDDEVRLPRGVVDGLHHLRQGLIRLRIGRALIPPVGIGELKKEEIIGAWAEAGMARRWRRRRTRRARRGAAEQVGREDDAAQAHQLEQVSSMRIVFHGTSDWNGPRMCELHQPYAVRKKSFPKKKPHPCGRGNGGWGLVFAYGTTFGVPAAYRACAGNV